MAAGSIVLDLIMRTGSFETDTKRAEKRLAEFKREAEQMGKAVGAAAAAAAVALGYMVKQSINMMDEMDDLSQQIGVNVKALSSLSYAAELSGVTQETLGGAMVKLSKGMSDATQGTGEAIKAFQALGINVKNADGTLKTTDQTLVEIAEKFSGMKDGAEKTALAVALFGRSGAQLIHFLNEGSTGIGRLRDEAEKLGLTFDETASKAAGEFNDNLFRIQGALKGMVGIVARDALPTLNDMAKVFLDIAKNQDTMRVATSLIETSLNGLKVVLQTVAIIGANVGFVFQQTGREIGAWAAQMNALGLFGASNPMQAGINVARSIAGGGLAQVKAIREAALEEARAARAALDNFERQVMGVGGGGGRQDPRLFTGGGTQTNAPAMTKTGTGGGSSSSATESISAAERQIQAMMMQNALLEKQLSIGRELNNQERLQVDLYMGKYGLITEEERKNLERNALLLDVQEKKLQGLETEKKFTDILAKDRERMAQAALDQAAASEAAFESMKQSMLDNGPNAQLEKTRKILQGIADDAAKGKITWEQYADALEGVSKKTKETDDFARQMGMTFSSAFEDAVLSGKKFSDVLKGVLRDIMAIMFRKNVTEPLGNMFTSSGGGSSGGGWMSSVATWIGSFFGGSGANGVATQPGRSYLVGENGPEMFVPNTAGKVMPGNDGTTVVSAPQIQVNVINNTGTQMDAKQRQRQDGGITQIDVMLEQVESGIAKNVQRGSGPLSEVLAKQFGMNRASGALI